MVIQHLYLCHGVWSKDGQTGPEEADREQVEGRLDGILDGEAMDEEINEKPPGDV